MENLEGTPAEAIAEGDKNKKEESVKSTSNWLLWWKIDPRDIARQVEFYGTLKYLETARGMSVGCLALSMLITLLFIFLGVLDKGGVIDVAIFAVLALLIHQGYKWASIAAMVIWSIEKVGMIINPIDKVGSTVGQIIWWAIYMHAFWYAYKVEKARGVIVQELSDQAVIH